MSQLEALIKAMDSAVWEMGEAFKGLEDGDLWRRADARLLSVGENAAHAAYWEAQTFFGDGFESPLVAPASRYYTSSLEAPFALEMGAEAAYAEVKRVHEACRARFAELAPGPEENCPFRGDWTWA